VKRTFDLLNEFGHIIERNSRLELAEIAHLYLERFRLGCTAFAGQSVPQRLVDDISEGAARAARFGLQLGSNIVVKCQRSSHALMLRLRHHDVNAEASRRQRLEAASRRGVELGPVDLFLQSMEGFVSDRSTRAQPIQRLALTLDGPKP